MTGAQLLIDQQKEIYRNGDERVQKCLELARHFYPAYSEPVILLMVKDLLSVAKRFELEHSWTCPGEECSYWRAVLEDNAKRAGLGEPA